MGHCQHGIRWASENRIPGYPKLSWIVIIFLSQLAINHFCYSMLFPMKHGHWLLPQKGVAIEVAKLHWSVSLAPLEWVSEASALWPRSDSKCCRSSPGLEDEAPWQSWHPKKIDFLECGIPWYTMVYPIFINIELEDGASMRCQTWQVGNPQHRNSELSGKIIELNGGISSHGWFKQG